jgi:hypothetical protein
MYVDLVVRRTDYNMYMADLYFSRRVCAKCPLTPSQKCDTFILGVDRGTQRVCDPHV